MRIYGGLQSEDWQRWGEFTTFKRNAADLLGKSLRPDQIVYCSPPVDPYQPARFVGDVFKFPGKLRLYSGLPSGRDRS